MRFTTLPMILILLAGASTRAEEVRPSALQKKLIGHWISEKDPKLHFYYSQYRRLVDRDISNSDARLDMMDCMVWDEWPELRTLILTISEGTQFSVTIVITLSEDGLTAVCREKSLTAWSKSFKIQRVDDRIRPAKIPEKLKMIDLDSGVGPTP